ncbi:hypothetical protein EK0264_10700 [Epidermidibacterium keratini]|uniref:YfhO family protein n=1 Tax=Epidermidibacterium keratini TaxID=1891644 RepID=A0A7L4YN50_9ACTN|nr:hypothetical protein [Epidermidibacterium keratini]QHC00711.1 hypothetical protein EK0264_10700 [Epidermidibacterium keratini]
MAEISSPSARPSNSESEGTDASADVAAADNGDSIDDDAVVAQGASAQQRDTDAAHDRIINRYDRAFQVFSVLMYLILVVFGVTTSSLASPLVSENEDVATGTVLGKPQVIRTDEYLTGTPILLGYIAAGGEGFVPPLAQEPDLIYQIPSGSPVESVIFFDGSMLRLGGLIPDASLFAAFWWLPSLLLALFLPPWLRAIGCRRNLSYLAAALFLAAPATVWWSLMPIRLSAFTIAGCYGVMCATRLFAARRWLWGGLLCVLVGVLWARMPTNYVPWSIVLGGGAVLATFAYLLHDRHNRKAAIMAMATSTALALGFFGTMLAENWDSLQSELSTVYPGTRLTGGSNLPAGLIFGAPSLYNLEDYYPSQMNQSEISSAFTVCAVWAVIVFLTARLKRTWSATSNAIAVLAVVTGFWLSWALVNWGDLGELIPIANRLVPVRSAQVVGYLSVLLLVLVLSRASRRGRPKAYISSGIAVAAVTAVGASSLANGYGATLGYVAIMGISLIAGVLAAWLTARPTKWAPAAAIALAAGLVVYNSQPLQVGLGDFRESEVAQYLSEKRESDGPDSLWATDAVTVSSLITANGLPQASGNQVTGPIIEAWELIDPDQRYEHKWNRGASYLEFEFVDVAEPHIKNPSPDRIRIEVSPCDVAELDLGIKYLVTGSELDQSCVSEVYSFSWGGSSYSVYEVQNA